MTVLTYNAMTYPRSEESKFVFGRNSSKKPLKRYNIFNLFRCKSSNFDND